MFFGSFTKAGDTIRISVKIQEAASGATGGAGGDGDGGPAVDPEDFAEAQDAVREFIEGLERSEEALTLQRDLGEEAAGKIRELEDAFKLSSAEAAIFGDLAPTPEVEALREAFRTLGADAQESIRVIAEEIEAAEIAESFDEQIEALEEEIELLGADNEQLAINAELRALAGGATVEQAEKIRELTQTLLDETDALRDQEDSFQNFFENVGDAAERELSGILADPLGEGLDELPARFSQILLDLASQALASEVLELLQGLGSSGGGGTGGFIQFIGGLFGGGFQAGGQVSGTRPILVGERGPEIFQPPASGTIVPDVSVTAQAGPQNTTIVNTIDNAEITGAFNSPEGDQVLLNRIGAKRTAFRQALGV